MSRNVWQVYVKTAGTWVSDGSIYRPNDNFNTSKVSTQTKIPLDDGSQAFVTPSTKYLDGSIMFVWYWDDSTVKSKVNGYITNQSDIKIVDDLANDLIGRFVSIESVRIVGQSEERYDLKAVFEIMPGLE